MRYCVVAKYGELALKGRNRPRFVARLRRNLRRRLGARVAIEQRAGAFVLVPEGRPCGNEPSAGELKEGVGELLERARDVLGIAVLHPAVAVDKQPEAASAAAVALLRDHQGSFAIRARRRDKRFALSSRELAIVVGAAVQRELGLPVDLSEPGREVHLEVDEREIFVFTERIRGRGGLPVGVSGRALVLISGGIDSPVAAYRAMRRGLRCDFVHFSGEPFTGPESIYKAYANVRTLDRFQGGSRLWVVPFGRAQRMIAAAGAGRLQVMAQRRLMVRVASRLAERVGAAALVTGDALGQVASQTLANLAVVDDAAELPLLRPLLAFDKAEIIAQAEELGTFEVSRLPDEDCCQLFAHRQAETRARVEELRKLERAIDVEELAEGLVAQARELRPGSAAATTAGRLEVAVGKQREATVR